ncbi:MAG: hypothetical protein LBR35_02285 [Rickettsiales bacterium]|jgi:hypothetical protein|nr:hypothetical protein [Rickettsiales bacterium]
MKKILLLTSPHSEDDKRNVFFDPNARAFGIIEKTLTYTGKNLSLCKILHEAIFPTVIVENGMDAVNEWIIESVCSLDSQYENGDYQLKKIKRLDEREVYTSGNIGKTLEILAEFREDEARDWGFFSGHGPQETLTDKALYNALIQVGSFSSSVIINGEKYNSAWFNFYEEV